LRLLASEWRRSAGFGQARSQHAVQLLRTVDYTNTEHFAVAKSFRNNHQKMIAELLSE
jgi:hypothetical protein